ncbi:hypothetical protein E2C01_076310 [Portunus trituberculatus]|uniref:Uncharacterized protein n=1 Tax=Portunus trituberculatus TaxID=210409 RepID=A0A5B7IB42_PORTR|nr:hypothetical protein [Portunus trituberculatus]
MNDWVTIDDCMDDLVTVWITMLSPFSPYCKTKSIPTLSALCLTSPQHFANLASLPSIRDFQHFFPFQANAPALYNPAQHQHSTHLPTTLPGPLHPIPACLRFIT